MANTLNAFIIGAGRVSGGLSRALERSPGVQLAAVADTDLARAEALANKYGVPAVADYRELLGKDNLDLAVIGLPHWLHRPVAIDCAKAGKHIYVEKPLANTVEEAEEMIAAAEANKIRLLAAHTQRFFSSTQLARQYVSDRKIGDVVFATDTWYKDFGVAMRPPWFLDREKGGGMWLMNGAHMIDRTCYILDSEVAAVKAWIGNPIYHLKADDSSIAFLQLKSGQTITLMHSGWKKGIDRNEVEIVGTDGMMRVDTYGQRLWLAEGGEYAPVEVVRQDAMTVEMTQFVAAIQNGGELPVPIEWGRHIMKVLVACEESSRTGREVVID